jgi:hypothetical protein
MSTGSQWRRPWVLIGGSVVPVSIATLIFPTVAIWLGVAVLMVCIGTVIHTAIRDTDLGPKQKAVLSFIERWSRRIMRLDRPGVNAAARIGVCAVAGIVLIASGGAVNAYRAEQQQQAKVKAAQLAADELQAKLQAETDAEEKANRRANAFLNDALTHLDLGDVASARKAIADSRAVPGADTEGRAAEISAKISQATDPTRLQAGLVELPDAAFEDAKAGRLPPQMATGHPGLDQRAAKVMATVLAGAVRQRENRRLAAIESERRKKEEAERAASLAAAKAAEEQRVKQKRDAEIAASRARHESPNRGELGVLKVDEQAFVWVAIDERSQDELNAMCSARNEAGVRQMIALGRVMVCQWGTTVTVVAPGFFTTTVRMMDGPYTGRTGIVPSEWVRKR